MAKTIFSDVDGNKINREKIMTLEHVRKGLYSAELDSNDKVDLKLTPGDCVSLKAHIKSRNKPSAGRPEDVKAPELIEPDELLANLERNQGMGYMQSPEAVHPETCLFWCRADEVPSRRQMGASPAFQKDIKDIHALRSLFNPGQGFDSNAEVSIDGNILMKIHQRNRDVINKWNYGQRPVYNLKNQKSFRDPALYGTS